MVLPIMINVLTFRVLSSETASSVNVAEVITSGRRAFSKRNLGYGFNVGDCAIIPSSGTIVDQDISDSQVYSPLVGPESGTGV